MTPKELVLRAVRFQEVPRLPAAVLDGHLWMMRRHGLSQRSLLDMPDEDYADLLVNTCEETGSDIVFAGSACIVAVQEVMGSVCDYSAVAAPVRTVKRAVRSLEDLRRFDAEAVWAAAARHPIVAGHRRRMELLRKKVGDRKLIMAFSLAPLTMAMTLVGMEDLLAGLSEEADLAAEAMEFGMALTRHMLDDQVAHGATGISMADPVSSVNVVSQETFLTLSLPRIRRMADAMRRHGLPIMLHICGDSTARLEPLRDAGVDIFSFDGGDLRAALETARGSYALFGNLDPVGLILNGTPETVAGRAAELAAIAGHGGGFILAPGCDLPPAAPLENVLAMTGAVRRRA